VLHATHTPTRRATCREDQQHGVAAELEQVPAFVVGSGEEFREAVVKNFRDFFSADLAVAGETLRHRRKAGDIHEDERALDGAPFGVRRLLLPLHQEAWEIGREGAAHIQIDVFQQSPASACPPAGP
jgi:hypothetical protein